ncbi:conserved hypothetical protein [Beutenbergia cavernae DSM 12333]|uniref:Integral membrane protein n=1 Tax=Beutenbergia cavernae (strain ATCC BAA-8 / DSM 12333 / CCUG 43141 / JCM 11478 / NBRC 16432 / NCIMB 13614 / HKI 0122) TaxID=471853 RepID=C5C0U7_BEUC1|nr:hypothetical protein [Beutenbergia cavernae]ACQ79351.1 conserved hypothetical protein [Beutenbergia cavernae DSM 12333]
MTATELRVPSSSSAEPTTWRRLTALVVTVAALAGILVTAFAWPAVNAEPRDVPIGLAAPPEAAGAITAALEQAQPGAFDVREVADEQAARAAVSSRELLGAIVVGPEGGTVLTAPAAGAPIAQALDAVAVALSRAFAQQQGTAPAEPFFTVEAVVPLAPGDPRGAGFSSSVLPVVLVSLAVGILGALAIGGTVRRLLFVGAAAVGAALVVALVADSWLGVLDGGWWAQAAVVALAIAAAGAGVVGLGAALGRAGIGIAVAVVMLLGNPLSGAAVPPELLPAGWSELGQALPPGAFVDAMRSVAYFGGADAATPLLVLGAWVAGGVALVLVGGAVRGRRAQRRA